MKEGRGSWEKRYTLVPRRLDGDSAEIPAVWEQARRPSDHWEINPVFGSKYTQKILQKHTNSVVIIKKFLKRHKQKKTPA